MSLQLLVVDGREVITSTDAAIGNLTSRAWRATGVGTPLTALLGLTEVRTRVAIGLDPLGDLLAVLEGDVVDGREVITSADGAIGDLTGRARGTTRVGTPLTALLGLAQI